jgi:two-component system chemotaxis sensor kinase CheA
MSELLEATKEFLVESHENLDQLDTDLVGLEESATPAEALGRIFRTLHTIKGSSSFLRFPHLEAVSHAGENLLGKLRDGEAALTPAVTDALLRMVDAIRKMLARIESAGSDGGADEQDLIDLLNRLAAEPAGKTVVARRGAGPAVPEVSSTDFALAEGVAASAADPAPSAAGADRTRLNEVVREFLIETHENLARLDLDLIALEKDPAEAETLARVFRTLHTVKGTAGFLGLQRLQAVSHAAENLLGRLRAGELVFDTDIAGVLLRAVDAVRQMLDRLESSGTDGDGDFSALIEDLDRLRAAGGNRPAPAAPPAPAPPGSPDARDDGGRTAGPAPRTPSASLAGPRTQAPEEAGPRASGVADSSIRVDVGLLDKLMTLVGELVLARNQIVQFSGAQEDAAFQGTVQRLNLLTSELQTGVMKTRLQPIGNVWGRFPRVVRDLALACGKQARIEMDGQDTELDKTIIEAIRDPLTHLVRNAIDHGIEPPAERLARGKPAEGRLALHAFHEGGKVIIEIADDGGGIDPRRVRDKAVRAKLVTPEQADRLDDRELVNLIFLPGFSTADRVTQFSGRGVGMDVVRTNVEKIGGAVAVESRPGQGTTVRMKIPLTLAIIPALTVSSGGDRYAIPQVSLLELVRLEGDQLRGGIEQVHGAPVYRLRGNLLPLVYLGPLLGVAGAPADGDAVNIVVLQADDRQFGLVVDAIHDTEEIVVKPLQKQIKGIGVFAGATVMGDGRVALILDVVGLAQRAGVVSGVRERALGEKRASTLEPAADRQSVLLLGTRDGGQLAIPLAQVARLEEFRRSALERAGTGYVVQYRGEILPLVDVSRALNRGRRRAGEGRPRPSRRDGTTPSPGGGDTVQVVVYAGNGRRVGLVVDRILDVAEETLASRSPAGRPGVEFTAVVQGRVTEFLDVEGVLRAAGNGPAGQPRAAGAGA